MNLNEFDKTATVGLYVSREEHSTFGKKFIARFQHDKKRYVKVLGYSKKDNLTLQKAVKLFEDFKTKVTNVSENNFVKEEVKAQNTKIIHKNNLKLDENLEALQDENLYLK